MTPSSGSAAAVLPPPPPPVLPPPVVLIGPLIEAHVRPIAAHMRESDRREICAQRWGDDPVALARDWCTHARLGAVFHDADGPVATVAAVELLPGLWSAGLFATPAWPGVAWPALRWCHRDLRRLLHERQAHRVEVRVMAGHPAGGALARALGAVHEATLPDYGRARETFELYAWRLSDVLL